MRAVISANVLRTRSWLRTFGKNGQGDEGHVPRDAKTMASHWRSRALTKTPLKVNRRRRIDGAGHWTFHSAFRWCRSLRQRSGTAAPL